VEELVDEVLLVEEEVVLDFVEDVDDFEELEDVVLVLLDVVVVVFDAEELEGVGLLLLDIVEVLFEAEELEGVGLLLLDVVEVLLEDELDESVLDVDEELETAGDEDELGTETVEDVVWEAE
jgi:hypothetical protein